MLLRDPVHGLMVFEGEVERIVVRLLATAEVQRLRRVRQLGLASLVYPGAEHTRFSHAAGAAHVMTRLLSRIDEQRSEVPVEQRLGLAEVADAVAGALLHDLGHGPFSHLFEDVLPGAPSHEEWSVRILRDPATEVHRALEGLRCGMSQKVADLLEGRHHVGYLSRAVSGPLDVDRSDYLLRDSHMTGVRYGLFDLEWLLRALSVAQSPRGDWVLAVHGSKAVPPVEEFFLGRHFMYRQVYHHRVTRAAECLVRAIFTRLAELVQDGTAPPELPSALRAAALGETMEVGEYLELDDPTLYTCFASWEKHGDPVLAGLTHRLRLRHLPKTLTLPAGDGAEHCALREEVRSRAVEVVEQHGLRADLSVWINEMSHVPFEEPAGESAQGVWVAFPEGRTERLGSVSFQLRELRNKVFRDCQLVFPAELRDEVIQAVHNLLPAPISR